MRKNINEAARSSRRRRMSFAQSLAKSLGDLPYSTSFRNEINWRRRRQPEGLAIDRLLSHAGITNSDQYYPPKSRQAFVDLIVKIESSSATRLFQSRALLFLFLDYSIDQPKLAQEQTVGEYYASQMWISEPEKGLITGLWYIDHGKAVESLEYLGQNWDLKGAENLHEYIVLALADQKPGAVVCYLAARGSPGASSDQLVKSLTTRGKFAEVLDISREHNNQQQYLKEIARAATQNKRNSLELAQLPCTVDEWFMIQEELNRIIASSSPSAQDSTATSELANNIILVRALHTGDTATLEEIRKSNNANQLYL